MKTFITVRKSDYLVLKKLHKAIRVNHTCYKCKKTISIGDNYRMSKRVERTDNGYHLYSDYYFCLNCCKESEETR